MSQALDRLQDGHRAAALSDLGAALRAYPPSLADSRVPAFLVAFAFIAVQVWSQRKAREAQQATPS